MDHEQRGVVLDFLCNSSYTNTARAFSRECTVRSVSVDADGDEVMSGEGRGGLANEEDADLILSEETLQQVELRKGECCALHTQAFALVICRLTRVARNSPKDSFWKSGRGGRPPPYSFPNRPNEVIP